MQSGIKDAGGAEQESTPQSKVKSRSRHVEVVLGRILAKRHQQQEQESSRHPDEEAQHRTEPELPVDGDASWGRYSKAQI